MTDLIQQVILAKMAKQTAEAEYKKLEVELIAYMRDNDLKSIPIEGVTITRSSRTTVSGAKTFDKNQKASLMHQYPGCIKQSLDFNLLWKVAPDLTKTTVSNFLTIKGLGFVEEDINE